MGTTEDEKAMPKAYYNEHDPKAAAWLQELIKAGLAPLAEPFCPKCEAESLRNKHKAKLLKNYWFEM
jgi:hypothetical protein